MFFSQKKTQLRDSNRATGFFLSSEQFSRVLTRERMRADRNGFTLSLLKLDFSNQHDLLRNNLPQLEETLRSRLRLTDDCSILDSRSIGLILPETEEAGALKLAEDLVELLGTDKPSISYAVYIYEGSKVIGNINGSQSSDDNNNDDHDEQNIDSDPYQDDDDRNGYQPQEVAAQSDHVSGERKQYEYEQPVAMVQPMQILLAAPMPIWKRMLDIVGASVGLILTAPILAMAAVLIKATSPGPIMFAQKRDGIGGRPFTIYKLRTMTTDAEAKKQSLRNHSEQDGPAFKIKNDPRITPVGHLLRKTSIDELPQLWNVLIGDMSLVGPRPLPCDESDACASWQRRRLEVTPGLTCIWQVYGRSQVSFVDWVRMDLEYIDSRSAGLDLKLLLQTVPAVLFQKGAR